MVYTGEVMEALSNLQRSDIGAFLHAGHDADSGAVDLKGGLYEAFEPVSSAVAGSYAARMHAPALAPSAAPSAPTASGQRARSTAPS